MPAVTKALRQPSSVPTRSNRNDSNADCEGARVRGRDAARVGPSTRRPSV
jgi:hypothetical protein